jgi:methionine aminopeptidase
MTIETQHDIDALKRIGGIVTKILRELLGRLEPGIATADSTRLTHARSVAEGEDGWTLIAPRGNLSAQYEHTLVITRGAPSS